MEYIDYFKPIKGKFLDNKIAVINGVNNSIGLSIAEMLISKGAKVVLGYYGDSSFVEAVAIKCDNDLLICSSNCANQEEAKRLISLALNKHKRIDILVNNPTLNTPSELENITLKHFNKMIDNVLISTFHACQLVAPIMKFQQYGKIVNIGHSIAKNGSSKLGAHFSAAHAGLLGLTKELTSELLPYNITVNAVAPGAIRGCIELGTDTNMSHIPLGREGEPSEVAAPVLFLCSDYSNYMSGTCIDVNGGAYMD